MIFNKNTADKTSEFLLQIKAIKLQPEAPFTWASGWKSPIYCDNRILLSYPVMRNYVKEQIASNIEKYFSKPDVIVGVATGAIGIGALVADYLNLPFAYVRPEPKKHGRQNQIEGHITEMQSVIVIEDLISTGMSSLNAVAALRDKNIKINGMAAIFSYDFDIANDNFKNAEIELRTLSNYNYLLAQALKTNQITKAQKDILIKWNANPSEWSAQSYSL